MRTTLSLLLFAHAICFALGVEDTGFYGVLDSGKLVRLQFKDTPQDWSNRNVVYGTSEPGALFFCWGTKINEIPTKFSCTSAKGSKPTVVYDALPISPHGAHPPKGAPYADEYKKLSRQAKLGTATKQGDVGLTQNCSSKAWRRRQYACTTRSHNAAGAVLRKSYDGVVLTIYQCSSGCSFNTPPRLYEVGKYD